MFKGTDKQKQYLEVLIKERVYSGELSVEQHLTAATSGGVSAFLEKIDSSDKASMLIEELIAKPRILNFKQTSIAPSGLSFSSVENPPIGIHSYNDVIYKVQASRQDENRLYAKKLTLIKKEGVFSASWEYVGRKPFPNLSSETLVDLTAAKKFGLTFGVCVVCGRGLTDEKSIEAGIGPVCAGKM